MDATPIIIKKKKAHAHAHHGGSWKVAYADFVTAMMAFFMVMWIMGLSDDTRAQIQGYFNDPLAFAKTQPKSRSVISPKGMPMSKPGTGHNGHSIVTTPYEDARKAMEKLKKDLESKLKASPELAKLLQHVKIQVTDEGFRIDFIEDKNDFFETGQAVLKAGAVRLIQVLGPQLAATGRKMIIEGHTDSVPYEGDPVGNFVLSTERAKSLLVALSESHVPVSRFKDVKGLADTTLRDPAHPTSAVNRRVSILLPFDDPLAAKTALPVDEVRHLTSGSVAPPVSVGPRIPNIVQGNN